MPEVKLLNKLAAILALCFRLVTALIHNVHASSFSYEIGDMFFEVLSIGKHRFPHVSMLMEVFDTEDSCETPIEPYQIVLEAVPPRVRTTTLSTILDRNCGCYAIGRLQDEYRDLIPRMINWLRTRVHKGFNTALSLKNDNTYYCAELVAKSMLYANDGQWVIEPHEMKFKESFWQIYFEELQQEIPIGELGFSPQSIWNSTCIKKIYSSCRDYFPITESES